MPYKVACPDCRATLMVPDGSEGKKIRCKKCEHVFPAPAEPPAVVEDILDEDDRPRRREERLQEKPRPSAPVARGRRDDDEDDKPRRRRIHEEDEDDDRPRRRAPAKKEGSSKLPWVLAGLGVLLLPLGLLALLGYWLLGARSSAPPSVVQANPGQPIAIPGQPPVVPLQPPAVPGQPPAVPGQPPGVPGQPPAVPGQPPAIPGQPPAGGAPLQGAMQALRYRWDGAPHVYAVHVEVEEDNYTDVHDGQCVVNATRNNRPRGPARPPEERKGTGTGFVVNPNGTLVTCAHVIAGVQTITVALGGKTFPATVIARDDAHDLAVLKINATNLPSLSLGDSEAARVGMEVRALGFPLSSLLGETLKATRGTLSGVTMRDGKKSFQVDASINPGNSGGPLVTESGLVLGVNSSKLSGDVISNVGFATPSNDVRTLLKEKGVAFSTDGWTARLDGPTLVEKVSPAVALVTVTGVPDEEEDTYRLTCQGSLGNVQKPKPGVMLMPRPPRFRFPSFAGPGQIDMDSSGQILRAAGGTQLPFLLGEMGVFLVDPLPPDDRVSWRTSSTCSIEESDDRLPGPFGRPFGPGGMFPGDPFGGGEPDRGNTREGSETAVYTRGDVAGGVQTIKKHYEMTVPGAGGKAGMRMVNDGTILFDVKRGLPRSVEVKGTLTVSTGNTTQKLPLTVTYRLLEGEERQRILNPPPPPPPQPLAGEEMTKTLANLASDNAGSRINALNQLSRSAPDEAHRAEVLKAVGAVLKDQNTLVRTLAVKTLAVWGTKDTAKELLPFLDVAEAHNRREVIKALGEFGNPEVVPALLRYAADADVFTRREAITALGKLKDPRAAEPLVTRMTDFGDRGPVCEALKLIGPKAEPAVLPCLKHEDWGIRMDACKVLAVIGTKASLPSLEAAAKDGNGLVALEAKKAVEAVSARK